MGCRMGRPPIGKIAMTSAERVRRHRLKHRPEPVTKPVTKRGTVDVEALVARIRELEGELARERKRRAAAEAVANAPGTAAEVAVLRQELAANARISELEAKLARRAWEDWRGGTAAKKGERAAAMAARAAAGPAQEGGGIACDARDAELAAAIRAAKQQREARAHAIRLKRMSR